LVRYVETALANHGGIDRRLLGVDQQTVTVVVKGRAWLAVDRDLPESYAEELPCGEETMDLRTRKQVDGHLRISVVQDQIIIAQDIDGGRVGS